MNKAVALAAALLLALLLPVLARAQAPGVTDTEIAIGLTTPLSGPAAAWGNTAVAMEAWAKHINEQGGVNGRKLKMTMKDDGYAPTPAVANLTEMKDSYFIDVGLLRSAIPKSAEGFPAAKKVPRLQPVG